MRSVLTRFAIALLLEVPAAHAQLNAGISTALNFARLFRQR